MSMTVITQEVRYLSSTQIYLLSLWLYDGIMWLDSVIGFVTMYEKGKDRERQTEKQSCKLSRLVYNVL